nr:ribonuclease H-like domain-containing protein [Tanacetum cinerariifolium]
MEDFIHMGSKEEAEKIKRKGLNLEQESAKKQKTSEEVPEEAMSLEEVPEEKVKEMMHLVPIEEVYIKALQVKHPIIDWKVYTEGQRSYCKITRLGGSSASYQFFIDLLKHLDREDLNQLWRLVKETLSNRPPLSDKAMELWVELSRLYEPDNEDQLWTHIQNFMHALMANDLILKIYKIANSPRQQVIDGILSSQVLLKVPRNNNMYSFDLKNVVLSGGLTCLFAKATLDESNLWHIRLGHINFKTMNKLVRRNIVRGLPLNLFENDHTCVACQKDKQHKASWNQTNGNAGAKANIDAGQARKKTVPGPQYILLPLFTSNFQGTKSSEDEVPDDARKKSTKVPRKENGVQEPVKEGDKNNQDKDVRDQEEEERAQRNEFKNLPTDPRMPNLEDTVDLQDTRIFSDAYVNEVEGAVADFNNLELTTVVSHIPTTRIHKDHPKEQIIGDSFSAPQTRRMIKTSQEHAMMDMKIAFLYGIIEEEVYVCQPLSFEDPHFPDKVYKVENALYGLHQAPKA